MSVPVTTFKSFHFDLSAVVRSVSGYVENCGYMDS